MTELGKPKEFSGHGTGVRWQEKKGAITVVIALVVLVSVLLVVSACVPTPLF